MSYITNKTRGSRPRNRVSFVSVTKQTNRYSEKSPVGRRYLVDFERKEQKDKYTALKVILTCRGDFFM